MCVAHGAPICTSRRSHEKKGLGVSGNVMLSDDQMLRVCKRFYVALIVSRLVQKSNGDTEKRKKKGRKKKSKNSIESEIGNQHRRFGSYSSFPTIGRTSPTIIYANQYRRVETRSSSPTIRVVSHDGLINQHRKLGIVHRPITDRSSSPTMVLHRLRRWYFIVSDDGTSSSRMMPSQESFLFDSVILFIIIIWYVGYYRMQR